MQRMDKVFGTGSNGQIIGLLPVACSTGSPIGRVYICDYRAKLIRTRIRCCLLPACKAINHRLCDAVML